LKTGQIWSNTMELNVNGHTTYCYTGGKTREPAKPTVVFIHGALGDHSVWILQSRYFANHGWNVLAPDLPGHCRSEGAPPESVAAAADFVIGLIRANGPGSVSLVGHSFGSLIALEAAARAPALVNHLVLIGAAFPMKVSDALLEGSVTDPIKAMALVNVFSRSTLAAPPSVLGPGTWVYGGSLALAKRVFASNPKANVFHASFKACNDYTGGEAAMGKVFCPVLFILGSVDQMTPPKAAQGLIKLAQGRTAPTKVAAVNSGHHQMAEAPEETLAALREFLNAKP
jgi:pimeloyl-ACP methyl ester carboxylesterase